MTPPTPATPATPSNLSTPAHPVDDRLLPADGAGWRPGSATLDLRLAGAAPAALHHLEVDVVLGVDLDERAGILDVDLVGLPPELLAWLSRYTAPADPSARCGSIALDQDAAWLWLHVRDGRRASRHRQPALVRFSFAGPRLVAVRAVPG
ncbi:hypothetical protein [Streptosporangium sp. NPDC002524]|uniref:hypothetical protein n=1 Tax=Streptosporangium sp. NPDC002524 TaxID=3154537 RepID=UPI00331C2DD7